MQNEKYLHIAFFMRRQFAALAYEGPLQWPHEERLADLTFGRYIDHGQYEIVTLVLNGVVHL